jgi:RNA polymerase sigma-70 factor
VSHAAAAKPKNKASTRKCAEVGAQSSQRSTRVEPANWNRAIANIVSTAPAKQPVQQMRQATPGRTSGIISLSSWAKQNHAQAHMPTTIPAKQIVSLEMAEGLLQKAATPADWQLTPERILQTLERSVAHRFANALPNDARTIQGYLDSLHASDLALACACSNGNAAAWDFFVVQYRPELYRAARAIAGEAASRELADSLYAELYGLREVAGQRRSLFDYFLGRSKLTTWLHAILAQRHVDAFRRARHTESLDDDSDSGDGVSLAAPTPLSSDPERERYLAMLQGVLLAALGTLEERDRLRLAYYYVEGLTLAQIGKLVGEHEATVSRKLERTRREVRKHVEAALRREKKLSDAQLRLCYEYAREEWPFDLTQALSARE